MRKILLFTAALFVTISAAAISASAQAFPELGLLSAIGNQKSTPGTSAPREQGPQEISPQAADAAQQNTSANKVVILRGTRVLMVLTSPLHSTSGTVGSGVYLEVVTPVVQQDRVVIPAHTYVQGTVEGSRRPGHFHRSSEFKFRFTTMIFPNNSVAMIDGIPQSIPGAKTVRARGDEGTLQTVDQTEKVLLPAAAGAVGGAIVGSVARVGIGKLVGAGLGAGLGMGDVLLQRGDEIDIPAGTRVEMVLRSDIMLSPEQARFNGTYVAPPTALLPPQPAPSTPAQDNRRHRHHYSAFLWPLL